MKKMRVFSFVAVLMIVCTCWGEGITQARDDMPAVYTVALFSFEERGNGVQGYGSSVADIIFARLVGHSAIMFVEREEIEKLLAEAEMGLSGIIDAEQASRVGRLTGAKILLTGSVFTLEGSLYVVAKIIGTETGRVLGESVTGKAGDLTELVETLASSIGDAIVEKGAGLVVSERSTGDRVAALKASLGSSPRPSVQVTVEERHVGQPSIDPAAETELELFLTGTGFQVVDTGVETGLKADIVIEGEGFSEFAVSKGNLVSVKARLEVRALDRQSGLVIASERQTAIVVDLAEQIAGKKALQQAAAAVAELLLPKLVSHQPTERSQ